MNFFWPDKPILRPSVIQTLQKADHLKFRPSLIQIILKPHRLVILRVAIVRGDFEDYTNKKGQNH